MADIDLRKPHVWLAGGVAAAAVLVFMAATRKAGGTGSPAAVTEALINTPDPAQPNLCHPQDMQGDIVFTAHRFPSRIGGDITYAIHHGHTQAGVPETDESFWITKPVSEMGLQTGISTGGS